MILRDDGLTISQVLVLVSYSIAPGHTSTDLCLLVTLYVYRIGELGEIGKRKLSRIKGSDARHALSCQERVLDCRTFAATTTQLRFTHGKDSDQIPEQRQRLCIHHRTSSSSLNILYEISEPTRRVLAYQYDNVNISND